MHLTSWIKGLLHEVRQNKWLLLAILMFMVISSLYQFSKG